MSKIFITSGDSNGFNAIYINHNGQNSFRGLDNDWRIHSELKHLTIEEKDNTMFFSGGDWNTNFSCKYKVENNTFILKNDTLGTEICKKRYLFKVDPACYVYSGLPKKPKYYYLLSEKKEPEMLEEEKYIIDPKTDDYLNKDLSVQNEKSKNYKSKNYKKKQDQELLIVI